MDQESKKHKVAEFAINYINNNEVLGIGSGSTVEILISYLPKVRNKIQSIVSSSTSSTKLLEKNGFDVYQLKDVGRLTNYIDGADEVNKYLQMIKGGGGALTREKILAHNSDNFVCIVDESKKVDILGTFPLPLEVIPIAQSSVAHEIIKIGGRPVLRPNFVTDNGNIILDVHNFTIEEPLKIEALLNNIPGIVTNGIFAQDCADILLCAKDDEVEESKSIA